MGKIGTVGKKGTGSNFRDLSETSCLSPAFPVGLCVCVIMASLLSFAPTARAQESPAAGGNADLAARVQAIEAIVQQQKATIEIQQRQIEELKAQGEKSTDSVGALEAKMQKAEKTKPVELPSWMDGLKFSGDLRMRYEGVWLEPRPTGKYEDQRGRFRLRFGFEKKVNDDLDAGFRLATGKDNAPTTANQTMTDDFSKKMVWVDLAYLTFHPTPVPGLTMGMGKFKNPYVNTDMVWSGDLNPEGAYETYKVKLGDVVEPFITLGQNIMTDNSGNGIRNATLMAYQPGVNVHFTRDVTWTSAAAYYDFMGYAKKGNFLKSNGNTVDAGGNLAAKDFNVLNFTNIVKLPVAGVPVSPYVDFAKNLRDQALINGTKRDIAWAAGVQVGEVKNPGDWSINYKYARIDADAVVGGINDDPFGFANTRGHKIGASYGLAKNTTLAVNLFFLKPVTGAQVKTTTLQADLIVKF